MLDKEDLLIAGGAVAAFFGLNWLMNRRKAPVPPAIELPAQPAPPSAAPRIPTAPVHLPTTVPMAPPPSSAARPASSRFSLGTGLRTVGPYPEIGFRVGSVTAQNTGLIPKGQFAGIAEGKAFRYGAHVFERLNRHGQTIFIVQQLLEPMTSLGPIRSAPAPVSPIRSLFTLPSLRTT